uniref:Uncharacterized protein n=1 Tax=Sphaerodactylus townsendi TaxID=933632 RepID=A0ACB8E8P2_9SAUR
MSPVSPVTFQPVPDYYFGKPAPAVDKPGKRLTPWEAASKSPLGLVDDAFGPQTIQESIAANVVSAARRKTLPTPPDSWKQKVAYQPPAPNAHAKLASFGRSHSAAMSSAKSTMSAPSSTMHCGSRLQYAYYGQRARTDPDMVSMDSRIWKAVIDPKDFHILFTSSELMSAVLRIPSFLECDLTTVSKE